MGKQALAAAGLCVALAGCGGGREAPPPPTRSAFVARADRVCAEAKTRSERLRGLRALRPPAGEEGLYSGWLSAEAGALGAPPKGEDPLVLLAVAEGKVVGYARRMGAETCAKRAIGTMPP